MEWNCHCFLYFWQQIAWENLWIQDPGLCTCLFPYLKMLYIFPPALALCTSTCCPECRNDVWNTTSYRLMNSCKRMHITENANTVFVSLLHSLNIELLSWYWWMRERKRVLFIPFWKNLFNFLSLYMVINCNLFVYCCLRIQLESSSPLGDHMKIIMPFT